MSDDPQGEVERLRLCSNLVERASLLRAPDASALDNETAVLLLEAEVCITLLADDLVSARVDPKHQALAELDEIADGAWGDGPRTRGLAKRKAEALRPSAGAGEIEALVQRLHIEAKDRSQYAREEGMEDGESERDEETARVCTLAARVLTALTAPAPDVQTEAAAVSSEQIDRCADVMRMNLIAAGLVGLHGTVTVTLDQLAAHVELMLSEVFDPGLAALDEAAPGVREAMEEAGWLIERRPDDGPPKWMCLTEGLMVPTWVTDASKALRFARRQDAEAYFAFEVDEAPGIYITEHKWMSP